MKKLNQSQKDFIGSLAKGVVRTIEDSKLEIKKTSLSFEDMSEISKLGVEVSDEGRTIVDNMPYVEYELVKVSQRIFERPIANQPFTEFLYADGEDSTDGAIVYKYVDFKGGFTKGTDKSSSNSIVSNKHGSEAYTKEYLSAYLEDVSLYEIAVAISKGLDLSARMLRALYVAYEKTMNKIIFAGVDAEGATVGKYALNTVAGATVTPATDTWQALVTAGNSIGIYKDLATKIATMEDAGSKADGEFTPDTLVLPVKQFGLLRQLMDNSGYFNGTIREYVEKQLNLKIVSYADLKGAGAAQVDRAILMNSSEVNGFYGLPNALSVYEDQKFDINSKKSVFQTTGLIVVNSGAYSAIDGI
jgi:hypothetical protein